MHHANQLSNVRPACGLPFARRTAVCCKPQQLQSASKKLGICASLITKTNLGVYHDHCDQESMKQEKMKRVEPGMQEPQGSKLLGSPPPCQPAAGGGHRLGVEGGESGCLIWTPSIWRLGLAARPEEQTLPRVTTCISIQLTLRYLKSTLR